MILDPVKNAVSWLQVEPRDKSHGYSLTKDYYHGQEEEQAYVGEDKEWMASPHNPMFDEKGRLWMTVQIRAGGHDYYPAWAKNTIVTDNPADVDTAYNLLSKNGNNMQLGYYDTKTNKFVTVDTGYNTHHLQLDWQDRIWTDGGGSAAGELDTKKLDLTSLDTIKATEAGAEKIYMRIDPDTKKMIPGTGYGEAVSPVDGTVWYTSPVAGGPANKLYMVDPKTDKIKDYPLPPPGRFPHGIDFSTDGNVWVSLGSGQLGRLNPKTGEWKFWDTPGLKFKGTGKETGSTDFPYYLWVDQFNASGLGKDTVFETGTTSDAQFVFDPKKETFVVFHVPYPMPYYARGLDGRIDDPNAGWKGRGLWMTYSSYLPRFTENAQRLRESHANPPQSIGELIGLVVAERRWPGDRTSSGGHPQPIGDRDLSRQNGKNSSHGHSPKNPSSSRTSSRFRCFTLHVDRFMVETCIYSPTAGV